MNDQMQTAEERVEGVRRLGAQSEDSASSLAGDPSPQPSRVAAAGEVATALSHRLNNLLMVIVCSAEFIRDTLSPNSQAYGDVEELLGAAREAVDLTRKLKAFSGRQQLNLRAVDLNQLLQAMAAMLQRLVGGAVQVELLPQVGLPSVTLDPGQFHQVLRHLALNAGEAMPGGGRLTIATGTVSLAASDGLRDLGSGEAIVGDFVSVTVSDTGGGIPAAILGRVLEPFFTTKPGAQGLGLSVAYGVIRQHRGFLAVSTPPSGGTVVRIYLPRAAVPEPCRGPLASGAATTPPEAAGISVLLVEDEDSLRRLTARNLTRLGYRVLAASSAEAALELMRQHADAVSLLITDVGLPGMNGKTLAGKLTAEYPRLKVIIVSGYPGDLLEQHGIGRRGAFLMKPFTRDVLERRIRETLAPDGKAGG